MKIQLLPNYFKWIGLLLFFVGGVPSFIEGWNEGALEGWKAGSGEACNGCDDSKISLMFSEQTILIAAIISLIGMIVYSLSKEKIEDEFIQTLRWESVTSTFGLSILFVLACLIINAEQNLPDAYFVIQLQLMLYLIIFFFKKRSHLGEIT